MAYPAAAVCEEFDLAGVYMDRMGYDGALAQDTMLYQAVDHPQAALGLAVVFIRLMLRHVNVESGTRRCTLHALLQRFVGERQTGM